MNKDDEIFSQKMKLLRNRMGYTQEEMAKVIGVRKTTICNYESGYSAPTLSTLKTIMSKFNLEPGYFFSNKDVNRKAWQPLFGKTIPYFLPANIKGLTTANKFLMDSPLTLPQYIDLPQNGCIATSAPDNSMNLCGIDKNSTVIIDITTQPRNGKIFAAVSDHKLLIRKYHKDSAGIYMTNESTKIPSGLSREEIPEDDFMFLGIITKIIRDI